MAAQPSRPRRTRLYVSRLVAVVLGVLAAPVVATPSLAATTCSAQFVLVWAWPPPTGSTPGYQGEVLVTDTGPATSVNWRVDIVLPTGNELRQYWNAALVDDTVSDFEGTPWNSAIPAGGSTSFGYIATWPSATSLTRPVSINCTAT